MKILDTYIQENMPVLLKRISGVVVNPTDREDIIQEACIAILQAKPNVSEEDLPKYFTRVLFTKVAAYKNGLKDFVIPSGFVGKEVCPNSNPLQELMDAENSYLIPDLIKDYITKPDMQEAMYLVYCEGCKPQVAADIVGVNRPALDMAVARFKKLVGGTYEGMRE
jgi:DNA-directed RNA polymerase specialized sigma24 family protein